MFATIRAKWNAFKENWQEYQKLRRVAARALYTLDTARAKITVSYDSDEIENISNVQRCIERRFVLAPYPMNLSAMSHNMLAYSYCPHFKSDMVNESDVIACTETNCPCYAGNRDYVDAARELDMACKRCQNFWNKSKTK